MKINVKYGWIEADDSSSTGKGNCTFDTLTNTIDMNDAKNRARKSIEGFLGHNHFVVKDIKMEVLDKNFVSDVILSIFFFSSCFATFALLWIWLIPKIFEQLLG